MKLIVPIWLTILLGIVGCSDSDPASTALVPSDGSETGATMIGGGYCTEGSTPTIIGMTDENGDFVPVEPTEPIIDTDPVIRCDVAPPAVIDTAGITMNGSGSIEVGSDIYPLSAALFTSLDTPDEFITSERSNVYIIIHDGETRFRRLEDEIGGVNIDYGMTKGRVAISVELSAAGSEGIENRTFEISTAADDGNVVTENADSDVALDAILAIDFDGSDQFSVDELSTLTQGQITWVGSKPDVTITINALTADGLAISGSYTGDLVEIPNQ